MTLLESIIADAWDALTDEQRTLWNFWTLDHPHTTATGKKLGLYGWQGYYQRNAWLAIADVSLLLSSPPTDDQPPLIVNVTAAVAKKKSQLSDGTTVNAGFAWLQLQSQLPSTTALIVIQGNRTVSPTSRRPPRARHVTVVLPNESGPVNLQVARGWYALTAGVNRYSSIKGYNARRLRRHPLAKLVWVNTDNGATTFAVVPNPWTP